MADDTTSELAAAGADAALAGTDTGAELAAVGADVAPAGADTGSELVSVGTDVAPTESDTAISEAVVLTEFADMLLSEALPRFDDAHEDSIQINSIADVTAIQSFFILMTIPFRAFVRFLFSVSVHVVRVACRAVPE